jgi:sugar diacid utilization regulator
MSGGPASGTRAGGDLAALDTITEAVESGAGLPDIVRAAARALDASVILIDGSSAVLAVAARSPADERSLMADGADVTSIPLRVADQPVGHLRMRVRGEPSPMVLRVITTLIASEVERIRAPERASEVAAADFLHALLQRDTIDRADLLARAKELMIDLESGGSIIVAHAHPHAPTEDGWRARVLSVVERGARAAAPACIAAPADPGERADAAVEVVALVPVPDDGVSRRAAEAILRELQAALPGFGFAVGRSRVATDPTELWRAGKEALLAANVAHGNADRPLLAFDETGAYRLLLPAMSEDPAELQRFYSETVEPLVAYDEQYETDLVQTVEAFLEADGNVAGTAQRLFTHRHTIRYRLERVRDLSGHDVGSSDGREKLSLGLKAMRVLGIASAAGPATEAGAAAGRVPRGRSSG